MGDYWDQLSDQERIALGERRSGVNLGCLLLLIIVAVMVVLTIVLPAQGTH